MEKGNRTSQTCYQCGFVPDENEGQLLIKADDGHEYCDDCYGKRFGSIGVQRLDELEKKYPILKFFQYDHLPAQLHEVSSPFCVLAYQMAERQTTAFAEVAAGLRKLLEAKDCAVRAALP